MCFSIQINEGKMSVHILKKNNKAASGIAVVLSLLSLFALTSVNAYQVGETFRDCETCPEMVVLPAGEFMMGSPEGERGRSDAEEPQHKVTIPKPFAVGKYEVTVGQYAEFVKKTEHKHEGCGKIINHPVACVSWDDASAYAYWLSLKTGHEYRLLTEAKWEYAARAGTTTAYHFGRMILGNMAQYESEGTAVVGSFPANAFGLHNMHGNVWEWVEDCWHDDYEDAPTDGSAWLSGCRKGNENDCEGLIGDNLKSCQELLVGKELRVLRGGSWLNKPEILRSANRAGIDAANRDFKNGGFRVARALAP